LPCFPKLHVDGFRFDLATALARDSHRVSKMAAFFETVRQGGMEWPLSRFDSAILER
jgi:pullulanase/glycogen debranching enzyme